MEIRPITEDEIPAWRNALITTFGGDASADTHLEAFRATVDRARALAAFDGASLVATTATFDLSLAVPGGEARTAGLTMVSVRPTHRRRGLLRALIQEYLDDARRRGEPLGALWASESSIYGRFGFGVASEAEEISFGAGQEVAPGRALDDCQLVELEAAQELLPACYEQVRGGRPGMIARTAPWWNLRVLIDRPEGRGGASPRRFVIARRGEAITGYAMFRQKGSWDLGIATGAIDVGEMVAIDGRAEATLWRFLSTIDLFPNVTWWNAPTDSLLPWLTEGRRTLRRRRTDALWLRIDDVATTLATRRYPIDGALRLEVADAGVFELRVDGGVGRCARVEATPDLRLDRAALGSIFLGAFAPSLLARAGRLEARPEALPIADRIFGWPVAPWIAEIF
jgi:predicted acetyltransferase